MNELKTIALTLQRLQHSASTLADGVRREIAGELSRQASALSADLAALTLRVERLAEKVDAALDAETPEKRPCARCGEAMAGVEGLCGPCEAQLRS